MTQLDRFLGLRNTSPPNRQPYGALAVADNVALDDSSTLETRPGFALSLSLAGVTDAYPHRSQRYALVVAGGSLLAISEGPGQSVLQTGLTDTTFAWAQSSDRVVFVGDHDAGIVRDGLEVLPLRFPDATAPDVLFVSGDEPAGTYLFAQVWVDAATGMQGPASAVFPLLTVTDGSFVVYATPPAGYVADLYVSRRDDAVLRRVATLDAGQSWGYRAPEDGERLEEAQTHGLPLPTGVSAAAVHESCLWVAVPNPAAGFSAVYASRPYFWSVFTADEEGLAVAGRVLALESTPQGLLIGTDKAVWLRTPDEGLIRLADYGVVPGRPIVRDQTGTVLLWTVRGLASMTGEGYVNLWADKLSVAPGSQASTAIVDLDGTRMGLVLTDTEGAPYSAY